VTLLSQVTSSRLAVEAQRPDIGGPGTFVP
jgi:hypothetical protein